DSQLADTLQVVVDFVQVAFRSLSQRDAIIGIAGSLRHSANLCGHAVRNCLTSSVVLGAVDAQTGRQALDGGTQGVLGLGQVILRNQSQVVGVDDRHGLLLMGKAAALLPINQESLVWLESWPFTWVSGRPCISCTCSLTAGPPGGLGLASKIFWNGYLALPWRTPVHRSPAPSA